MVLTTAKNEKELPGRINKNLFLELMPMYQKHIPPLVGLILLLSLSSSYATTIIYGVTNITGNTWEYTYNVANDTLGIDIEEFTIFFDAALYENLSVTSAPTDWDPLAIQPDPALPDDGFYDALALVVGIAPGDSLGGFGVQFDFLGTGAPGSQFFEVIDPFTFATLDSGFTQAIPLPAAIWLFGSGMLGIFSLGTARYRKSVKG